MVHASVEVPAFLFRFSFFFRCAYVVSTFTSCFWKLTYFGFFFFRRRSFAHFSCEKFLSFSPCMFRGGKIECRVQSAECRVQSAECRVQSAECRVQSAECRVQSAECRVQSAECRVQSAECRVQSAECRGGVAEEKYLSYLAKRMCGLDH